MEFILIILAVMLAVFLGWLLKSSFNVQPWVAEPVDETANQAPMNANAKVVALATLLAVVTSFFALIMSAYGLRMDYGDWVPLNEPQLLWLNTGMLFLASLVLQWTRNGTVSGQVSRLKPGLIVTGLLTFAFLAGQFAAWRMLSASGQYVWSNPANAFFYLLTVAHALHILGGMYVWARATLRVVNGAHPDSVRESVVLCTVYWHFLLIVWLVMFGLLLST
ncbi:MAG: cytochrome c oxidase subunit 3 [Gammaproteobacteria bacterium]|nr:cytochrome c oxidase subunit 3 [Gammaproteobacteria bacterium]MDH3758448.1 cytochrome c oxidase subunit 3 [Gammaproteobacteria bacterium]MDH3847213.1 cytochrome c oxidase subunit 3 [Gammaproteobacteria bacterium]MDH3864824.1 cytochrome c oxidase subunit 3 [Gammaproteobacteria bacterium]MDH3983193.1 cytochrome c oxidase subunit 3 [Gammaproteobacteria bacterium]